MGQGLSVGIDDLVDIKPRLFSKRKGSKNLKVDSNLLDLTNAKFGSGLEPVEGLFSCCVLSRNSFTSKRDLTHIWGEILWGKN
ncbi:hypothetical protein CFP56_035816 [Quercus suber]|uniref:Uncharacterized protein n=1 Tax=Quercus suber TaxID=58331 RepID=A0AAW0LRX9_QUESU